MRNWLCAAAVAAALVAAVPGWTRPLPQYQCETFTYDEPGINGGRRTYEVCVQING